MKTLALLSGERIPALGMGTWMMGEDPARGADEIAALQHGIDLGMRLIDTAEMYGEGASETLIGEAIRDRRSQVFLVSKVYPHNAGRHSMPAACERSLQRLGVDCLDLYLLHWSGSIPLDETIEAFERLRAAGKIRHWGVSNLDVRDMKALFTEPAGERCAVDQVLYNLSRRGIEWDLLPWCQARNMPVMAYSPLEQARLLRNRELASLAASRGVTPAQLALAWLLHQKGVIAIPKATGRSRVEENFGALDVVVDAKLQAALDRIFPPPAGPGPLEMI
ncbi:aldo/keto reductase [Thauera linaloolentis]|uniref:2,5-didehydrogluconate reductase n=1 Tax=Thauera linaloolentis (strain DSM 12138 / JCM 21573 / CCUG 41526 / CIP 105981 / IAM 15112 / NBRC 102519 / 47Lol) TaxID=1123367 RepID=N6YA90_THAL4|nr:aldo/keto reductase [Thauera linaloolentis]ENO88405.1 2,5-didehydrogluconate reductase [Thauera linaloolentis 47Lol = DSM 12138]MCM8566454.1 aldo/keto reductase [Thauera linaloolentis]